MSDLTAEAKCLCQRCNQPIAFPVTMHNEETTCPHCGKQTTLNARQVRALDSGTGVPSVSFDPTIENPYTRNQTAIVAAGYILAILIPFIGFFIGLYLMTNKRQGSGVAIIAISIVSAVIWYAVLTDGT